MPPEVIRWLPLVCVLAASYTLWSDARTNPLPEEKIVSIKLATPVPPKEYHVPDDIRDPFPNGLYEQLRAQGLHGKATGKDAKGLKTSLKPRTPEGYHIDGIIWASSMPMVIINGRTLIQGEKLNNMQVILITPNSVTMRIGRDIVTKTLKLKE